MKKFKLEVISLTETKLRQIEDIGAKLIGVECSADKFLDITILADEKIYGLAEEWGFLEVEEIGEFHYML